MLPAGSDDIGSSVIITALPDGAASIQLFPGGCTLVSGTTSIGPASLGGSGWELLPADFLPERPEAARRAGAMWIFAIVSVMLRMLPVDWLLKSVCSFSSAATM